MDTFDGTFPTTPVKFIMAAYEPGREYAYGQVIPLTHEQLRQMDHNHIHTCMFGTYWNNTCDGGYPLTRTGDMFTIDGKTYKIEHGNVLIGKHQVYIVTRWLDVTERNEFPSGLTGWQRRDIRSASAHMYMRAFIYYARDALITALSKRTITLDLSEAVSHETYKKCIIICANAIAPTFASQSDDELVQIAMKKLRRKDAAKLCVRAREGFIAMWRYDASTHLCWLPLDLIKIIAALCIDAPSLQ